LCTRRRYSLDPLAVQYNSTSREKLVINEYSSNFLFEDRNELIAMRSTSEPTMRTRPCCGKQWLPSVVRKINSALKWTCQSEIKDDVTLRPWK